MAAVSRTGRWSSVSSVNRPSCPSVDQVGVRGVGVGGSRDRLLRLLSQELADGQVSQV